MRLICFLSAEILGLEFMFRACHRRNVSKNAVPGRFCAPIVSLKTLEIKHQPMDHPFDPHPFPEGKYLKFYIMLKSVAIVIASSVKQSIQYANQYTPKIRKTLEQLDENMRLFIPPLRKFRVKNKCVESRN